MSQYRVISAQRGVQVLANCQADMVVSLPHEENGSVRYRDVVSESLSAHLQPSTPKQIQYLEKGGKRTVKTELLFLAETPRTEESKITKVGVNGCEYVVIRTDFRPANDYFKLWLELQP